MSTPDSNSFLLGEINATVKGTADDVKAIRTEVGDLARRVNAAEQRLTDIESQREIQVPQFNKLRHDFASHKMADTAWKSLHDGTVKGISTTAKVAWGGVTFLFMLATFFVSQWLTAERHGQTMERQTRTEIVTKS